MESRKPPYPSKRGSVQYDTWLHDLYGLGWKLNVWRNDGVRTQIFMPYIAVMRAKDDRELQAIVDVKFEAAVLALKLCAQQQKEPQPQGANPPAQ